MDHPDRTDVNRLVRAAEWHARDVAATQESLEWAHAAGDTAAVARWQHRHGVRLARLRAAHHAIERALSWGE